MGSDGRAEKKPQGIAGSRGEPENRALCCEEWESLAAEALDGSLGAAQTAAFEQHLLECPSCAQAWEQCRRGAEWLRFLEQRPQPPASLVDAILAATSGTFPSGPVRAPEVRPPFWRNTLSASRGGNAPGRLAPSRPGAHGLFMTAAMAFFSLALTLSLVSSLVSAAPRTPLARSAEMPLFKRLVSGFSPSSIGEMATRQYYSLQERGAKFYDNLPLVREFEAETRALSSSSEAQSQGGMAPAPLSASPRSRNGGATPLSRTLQPGELAVAWPAPASLPLAEQAAPNVEAHRFAGTRQLCRSRLYGSRA